jgi:phosphatidylserine/phosphatidylglycerophosphate/cardiolipin synthase-like enzyme
MKKKFIIFSISFICFTIGSYYLFSVNKRGKFPFVTKVELEPTPVYQSKEREKEDKSSLEIFFSPEDDIQKMIISFIAQEKKRILCAMYAFTDPKIVDALINAVKKGVELVLVIHNDADAPYNKILTFLQNNITVYLYPDKKKIAVPKKEKGLMHNKLFVFEKQNVMITGSYNCTRAAKERNEENIVVIKHDRAAITRATRKILSLRDNATATTMTQTQNTSSKKKSK